MVFLYKALSAESFIMASPSASLNGLVAVIVGAGGGIGRELAILLRRDFGCHLALCDVDQQRLLETVACVSFLDPHKSLVNLRTTTHLVDISNREAVMAFAEDVRADHGRCELVVNLAGVAATGAFEKTSLDEADRVISVNLNGVMNVSRAFFPLLKANPNSYLVNTTSALSSLFGPPGCTAHSASSFAVRGFTESLAIECAELNPNIHVSTAIIGLVKNEHLKHSQPHLFDPELRLLGRSKMSEKIETLDIKGLSRWVHLLSGTTSKDAAMQLVEGINQNYPKIFIGSDARMLDIFTRFFPLTWTRPWPFRFVLLLTLVLTRLVGRRIVMAFTLLLVYKFSDLIQMNLDSVMRLNF